MILAMVLEAAVMWALRWAFSPAVAKPDMPASNDNAPMADFDRVRDELDVIADLMEQGRNRDAYDELDRLCMLMDGHDEAARTDARWVREQQRKLA
ncbi:MAG: hypothetical protein ABL901_01150 [Hyphomicrobiaceae bacterium]